MPLDVLSMPSYQSHMASDNENVLVFPRPAPVEIAQRSSLGVFACIIYAVIMREVKSRFGQSNFGYVRALIEPVVFIFGFVFIWIALERATPIAVPIELFFLCRIAPYTAFVRTWEYTSSAIRANQGLLMFPVVRPLDFFVARTILEGASQLLVIVILCTVMHGIYGEPRLLPEDLLSVLAAFLAAIVLGAGFGLTTGCLVMEWPFVEVVLLLLRRIMFFTSGIFFIADTLPGLLKDVLWWNPMLHVTEWFRSAYFSEADSQFLSLPFIGGSILLIITIGLIQERRIQRMVL